MLTVEIILRRRSISPGYKDNDVNAMKKYSTYDGVSYTGNNGGSNYNKIKMNTGDKTIKMTRKLLHILKKLAALLIKKTGENDNTIPG